MMALSPSTIAFVLLVLFELLTPTFLLDFGPEVSTEPEVLGHTAAHDEPDMLCDLAPGNAVRKYELTAQPTKWEKIGRAHV